MKLFHRNGTIIIFIVFTLKMINVLAVDMSGLDCIIKPYETVELSSPVAGVIEEIHVKRGDFVEADQIVARLESGVEEASVILARARTQMRADIRAREATFELSKRSQNRVDELFKKKMVPSIEQDEAETAALVAKLGVMEAKESNQLATLELDRAIKFLKRRSIKSPINGVVVERYKSPGEYVEDQPVLKLAQIDPLNIEVIVPLALFDTIKVGAQAEIMLEKPVGVIYKAKVTIVDRVVDASSGTFGVRLEMPNPELKIPAGLRCDIRFLNKADDQDHL